MTRTQLEAVIDALAALIGGMNDAAADDDRGPNHDALWLRLYDDGSGRIGVVRSWTNEVEELYGFDDPAGLVKVLGDLGVEVEGTE
jgi:hypothetical protein